MRKPRATLKLRALERGITTIWLVLQKIEFEMLRIEINDIYSCLKTLLFALIPFVLWSLFQCLVLVFE